MEFVIRQFIQKRNNQSVHTPTDTSSPASAYITRASSSGATTIASDRGPYPWHWDSSFNNSTTTFANRTERASTSNKTSPPPPTGRGNISVPSSLPNTPAEEALPEEKIHPSSINILRAEATLLELHRTFAFLSNSINCNGNDIEYIRDHSFMYNSHHNQPSVVLEETDIRSALSSVSGDEDYYYLVSRYDTSGAEDEETEEEDHHRRRQAANTKRGDASYNSRTIPTLSNSGNEPLVEEDDEEADDFLRSSTPTDGKNSTSISTASSSYSRQSTNRRKKKKKSNHKKGNKSNTKKEENTVVFRYKKVSKVTYFKKKTEANVSRLRHHIKRAMGLLDYREEHPFIQLSNNNILFMSNRSVPVSSELNGNNISKSNPTRYVSQSLTLFEKKRLKLLLGEIALLVASLALDIQCYYGTESVLRHHRTDSGNTMYNNNNTMTKSTSDNSAHIPNVVFSSSNSNNAMDEEFDDVTDEEEEVTAAVVKPNDAKKKMVLLPLPEGNPPHKTLSTSPLSDENSFSNGSVRPLQNSNPASVNVVAIPREGSGRMNTSTNNNNNYHTVVGTGKKKHCSSPIEQSESEEGEEEEDKKDAPQAEDGPHILRDEKTGKYMRRTMNNTANSSTLNSSQVYSPLFHGSFTSSSIKELGDGKETDSSTSGSQNKLKEGQKKEGKRMNTSAVEVDEKEPKKEKGDQSDSSALRRTDRRRPPSIASEDATNPLLKSNCTMKDLQVHSVESTQDREEEEDTSTPTVPAYLSGFIDRPTNPSLSQSAKQSSRSSPTTVRVTSANNNAAPGGRGRNNHNPLGTPDTTSSTTTTSMSLATEDRATPPEGVAGARRNSGEATNDTSLSELHLRHPLDTVLGNDSANPALQFYQHIAGMSSEEDEDSTEEGTARRLAHLIRNSFRQEKNNNNTTSNNNSTTNDVPEGQNSTSSAAGIQRRNSSFQRRSGASKDTPQRIHSHPSFSSPSLAVLENHNNLTNNPNSGVMMSGTPNSILIRSGSLSKMKNSSDNNNNNSSSAHAKQNGTEEVNHSGGSLRRRSVSFSAEGSLSYHPAADNCDVNLTPSGMNTMHSSPAENSLSQHNNNSYNNAGLPVMVNVPDSDSGGNSVSANPIGESQSGMNNTYTSSHLTIHKKDSNPSRSTSFVRRPHRLEVPSSNTNNLIALSSNNPSRSCTPGEHNGSGHQYQPNAASNSTSIQGSPYCSPLDGAEDGRHGSSPQRYLRVDSNNNNNGTSPSPHSERLIHQASSFNYGRGGDTSNSNLRTSGKMNSTSTSGMSPGTTFLANLDRRADSSVSKSKQMLKEQENTNNNHTNATDNNNMNPNHNNAANATHNSPNKHENSEKKKKKSHGQASPSQYYEIDRMRLHDYIHGLHEVEMLYKSGLLTSDEDFLQMGLVYAIPGVRALSTGEVLAFSRSLWNKARSSKSTSSNSEVVERLMDDGTRIVPPPSGKVVENTADTSDSSNGGHPAVPRPPLLLPLLEGGESRPVKAADFTVFKGLVEKKLKEVEVHLGENELPDME